MLRQDELGNIAVYSVRVFITLLVHLLRWRHALIRTFRCWVLELT
jgi:hypothetical protein